MIQRIKRTARVSKYIIYKETLVDFKESFWSFLGAFIGIGLISYLQMFFLSDLENLFLIGSFGASSVLIYGAVANSWGFLFLLPLYLIYLFLKKPKRYEALRKEVEKWGLV